MVFLAPRLLNALVIEPNAEWLEQATAQFEEVVLRYKPSAQPVLKGLSFDIEHNEKIGSMGQTGAGKSTMTMAFFRINEPVSDRILMGGGKGISLLASAHVYPSSHKPQFSSRHFSCFYGSLTIIQLVEF